MYMHTHYVCGLERERERERERKGVWERAGTRERVFIAYATSSTSPMLVIINKSETSSRKLLSTPAWLALEGARQLVERIFLLERFGMVFVKAFTLVCFVGRQRREIVCLERDPFEDSRFWGKKLARLRRFRKMKRNFWRLFSRASVERQLQRSFSNLSHSPLYIYLVFTYIYDFVSKPKSTSFSSQNFRNFQSS